ncbi:hypothetical protein [Paraglaciecola aestuariivivens]
MQALWGLFIGMCLVLVACQQAPEQHVVNGKLKIDGYWLTEKNGQTINNPQSSGLVKWRDGLLTVSDRSADPQHRLRLRTIAKESATLTGPDFLMQASEQLAENCFVSYMTDNPDLEALAVDPDNDRVFYVVTEDATYAEPLSEGCQQKYANSGSTVFPSLLVRLELQSDNSLLMTHIRPIQFSANMQIGDFPNDGLEALAFGQQRTLYLGIEKDSQKQARIFSLHMHQDFWLSDDFIQVTETTAQLPRFESGNHPINGMDYYQAADGREFLLVAARNDESLWVVDLSGEKPAKILPIEFYAQIKQPDADCVGFEPMKNASIEGVAVDGQTLWLINDPWKAVYTSNIGCEQNAGNYEKFASLLFSTPMQPSWFE